jgi:hypothetical protein
VREVILSGYTKARYHSLKHYVYDIHVEHGATTDIPTIQAALAAMAGYKALVARLASSWPSGDLFYSRFELDIVI